MTMEYIRERYNVPAKRGMRVIAYGKPGVIVGADNHVRIRLDGEKRVRRYHPTDGIVYLDPTTFFADVMNALADVETGELA